MRSGRIYLSPVIGAHAGELSGTIVTPREATLIGVDVASGAERVIPLSGSGVITDVATSGTRIPLSRLARRADGTLGRDVVVLNRAGGEPERVIEHDSPRIFLGSPALKADGLSIIYDRQDPSRPPSEARVEEATLADGSRRTLAERGRFPTIHPDSSILAFVRWGALETLVVRHLQPETESTIVGNEGFLAIASPRFSPSGEWIAFAAVGDSLARRTYFPFGTPSRSAGLSRPARHGFPWEIWRVRPDGSDLQRMTELGEDEPSVTWSPDGQALAVHGGLGLTIVDVAGATPPRQIGPGGFGSIGWLVEP